MCVFVCVYLHTLWLYTGIAQQIRGKQGGNYNVKAKLARGELDDYSEKARKREVLEERERERERGNDRTRILFSHATSNA